ncbi:hypothetical protein EYF80_011227 [Liparis tanakae]|uniref:Uncharacterized protein n=1 Tax=Liparis tanakae TaxID=230148 RepID=A0A4Z2IN34_9TELE|nr:hypothetical protein EYF80_011227 [Liparis tanakae]
MAKRLPPPPSLGPECVLTPHTHTHKLDHLLPGDPPAHSLVSRVVVHSSLTGGPQPTTVQERRYSLYWLRGSRSRRVQRVVLGLLTSTGCSGPTSSVSLTGRRNGRNGKDVDRGYKEHRDVNAVKHKLGGGKQYIPSESLKREAKGIRTELILEEVPVVVDQYTPPCRYSTILPPCGVLNWRGWLPGPSPRPLKVMTTRLYSEKGVRPGTAPWSRSPGNASACLSPWILLEFVRLRRRHQLTWSGRTGTR